MALITEKDNSSNSYTIKGVSVYDFVPVVRYKNPRLNVNVPEDSELVLGEENANLAEYIEKSKRTFNILELTTSNKKFSLPFKVSKGVSDIFYDNDGYVKTKLIKLDSKNNKTTVIDELEDSSQDTDTETEEEKEIRVTGNKQFLVNVDKKTEFKVDIEIKAKKSAEYYLEFYAYDNVKKGDKAGNIDEDILCGRVKIITFFKDKDIFDEKEVKKLIDEISYVEKYVDMDERYQPTEYAGNYCMQASERGLSELLDDDKNFYSVQRSTHKRKNKIGFSGKTAMNRGNKFQSLGFVKNKIQFNGYVIDHKVRKSIIDKKSYKAAAYKIISFKSGQEKILYNRISNDLDSRKGYHVYYMAATGGFHTLLLVIDNYSNTKKTTYIIYDQHGETSSKGDFYDVGNGIKKQTNWTFANSCLNRVSKKTTDKWDSTETFLWKIQREK